jgi:hypothetical protein
MTTFADAISTLRDDANDVVEWLDEVFGRLSAVDWALIGVAFLILVWVVLSLRAATRIGPVTVEALTPTRGAEDKTPVLLLTAVLRETLARIGLATPASVPAGAPQADLIAAIDASGVAEAGFIAKLLQAIPRPRPPEYTVSGVVSGVEPGPPDPPFAGDPPPAVKPVCSLSYWVRPAREGSASLETVSPQLTHVASVEKAACRMYLHISQDAEGAFPAWARWTDASAVEDYASGRTHRLNGEQAQTVERLTAAAEKERLNVLARLELTNLFEASIENPAAAERAEAQGRVLRRYLDVACQWPSLVEPRYRASIVAAALATTCDSPTLTAGELSEVRQIVGLAGSAADDLSEDLRELAARESKAAVQLLKAWYALIREGRLRTDFEPKGIERRRLLHTARISEHCVRLRRFVAISPFRRLEIRARSTLVHIGVILFGQGEVSWQARYTAACFDSLLLRYLRLHARDPLFPEWLRLRKRIVLRRALRMLDRAVKDAGRELHSGWVQRDPDLAALQVAAPRRWDEIVGGVDETTTPPPLSPPDVGAAYAGLPDAPWPWMVTRAICWGVVALAGYMAFALTGSLWWWIVVGIGAWRARRALWELGVTSMIWRPCRELADSSWKRVRTLAKR